MAVSLTETVHKIGESLVERCRRGGDAKAALCEALEPLLAPSFQIRITRVKDRTGEVLIDDEIIVYERASSDTDDVGPFVCADYVAGALYVTKMLDDEALAEGFSLIGKVKALPPREKPVDEGWHGVPVGMIIAFDCDRPLEALAESVGEINSRTVSTSWPDAISILSRGIINYAVQFEGGKVSGDFILPNTTGSIQFAMYVHVMVSSLGSYTFNRTCGSLFMHLGSYNGKTSLPNNQMVTEGLNLSALNVSAYMFDLAGLLKPVPDHMRQDRGYGLHLMPYRIETKDGKLLSLLQFVPWLDGAGALRMYGNLPLVPFIILLGKLPVRVQEMKTGDGSISSILPIGRPQFELMLARMRQQSDFVIKLEQPSWTVTKMADEGTSSPFMARLFLNIPELEKCALTAKEHIDAFEKPYYVVLMSSITVRDLSVEITALIEDHRSKIARGIGTRIEGRTVHVDEPIDKTLRRSVEAFLNSANRVMAMGMKEVVQALKLDINFFFKKQSTFENGVRLLEAKDPPLAQYCRMARVWADLLNGVRNEMEHNLWSVPKVEYKIDRGSVVMVEPVVGGRVVTDFVNFITDRLICFVEDICAHGLQRLMPDSISVTEIPIAISPKNRMERFRICTAGGGMPLWTIVYHQSTFEET